MTVDEGERSTEGGLDFIDIKPGAASLQWKSDDSVAQSKARADFARRFPDSKSNPFGEEPEPEPTNLVTSSPTKLMTSSWIEVGVEADDDDGPPSPVMPSASHAAAPPPPAGAVVPPSALTTLMILSRTSSRVPYFRSTKTNASSVIPLIFFELFVVRE